MSKIMPLNIMVDTEVIRRMHYRVPLQKKKIPFLTLIY